MKPYATRDFAGGVWDNYNGPIGFPTGPLHPLRFSGHEGGVLLIMQPHHAPADQTPARVPTSVYRYYDSHGVLLYVGITSRGVARNTEHNKSKEWFRFVARQEVEHLKSRGAALNRENELIRKYHPPFNKQGNPGHEATREAYYLFRETPKIARVEYTQPVTPGPRKPKTLWFRRVTDATFELTQPIGGQWHLADIPRIAVKNHRRKAVGRLLDGRTYGDGLARITISMNVEAPPALGVVVAVKWLQRGSGHECVITSVQVPEDGGLRP